MLALFFTVTDKECYNLPVTATRQAFATILENSREIAVRLKLDLFFFLPAIL